MTDGERSGVFGSIIEVTNWIGYLSFAAIVLISSIDVLGRYLLNMPLLGGLEMLELSMAVLGGYTIVYTATRHMHISVDLFFVLFPRFLQKVVQSAGALMGTFIWGIMAYKAFILGKHSLMTGFSSAMLSIPVGPFEITLALALGLLSLVSLIQAIEVFTVASFHSENAGGNL